MPAEPARVADRHLNSVLNEVTTLATLQSQIDLKLFGIADDRFRNLYRVHDELVRLQRYWDTLIVFEIRYHRVLFRVGWNTARLNLRSLRLLSKSFFQLAKGGLGSQF